MVIATGWSTAGRLSKSPKLLMGLAKVAIACIWSGRLCALALPFPEVVQGYLQRIGACGTYSALAEIWSASYAMLVTDLQNGASLASEMGSLGKTVHG